LGVEIVGENGRRRKLLSDGSQSPFLGWERGLFFIGYLHKAGRRQANQKRRKK